MQGFLLTLALLFSPVVSADVTLSPTGGDDTDAFKQAFEQISQDRETIYIDSGSYRVTDSMPEIAFAFRIVGKGLPTIYVEDVEQFITITERDSSVENLIISGVGGRTSNGILVKNTSWARLQDLRLGGLATALHFKFAHDFRGLDNLAFYGNSLDFKVSELDGGHVGSSSFAFTNARMEHSLRAIEITTDVTNIAFINSGFAPVPEIGESGISITGVVWGLKFSGNRFEISNAALPSDSVYIKGLNYSYPQQGVVFSGNYFTGNTVDNHLSIGDYVSDPVVKENHFQTPPLGCDVAHDKNVVLENNSVLARYGRLFKHGVCEEL